MHRNYHGINNEDKINLETPSLTRHVHQVEQVKNNIIRHETSEISEASEAKEVSKVSKASKVTSNQKFIQEERNLC